jgi:hypothetical protein
MSLETHSREESGKAGEVFAVYCAASNQLYVVSGPVIVIVSGTTGSYGLVCAYGSPHATNAASATNVINGANR